MTTGYKCPESLEKSTAYLFYQKQTSQISIPRGKYKEAGDAVGGTFTDYPPPWGVGLLFLYYFSYL